MELLRVGYQLKLKSLPSAPANYFNTNNTYKFSVAKKLEQMLNTKWIINRFIRLFWWRFKRPIYVCRNKFKSKENILIII